MCESFLSFWHCCAKSKETQQKMIMIWTHFCEAKFSNTNSQFGVATKHDRYCSIIFFFVSIIVSIATRTKTQKRNTQKQKNCLGFLSSLLYSIYVYTYYLMMLRLMLLITCKLSFCVSRLLYTNTKIVCR